MKNPVAFIIACVPDDQNARDQLSQVMGVPCVPYKGSSPEVCQMCECKVWIGPMQQSKLAELDSYERGDVAVLCLPCAGRVNIAIGGPVKPLSQKQWGE